MADQSQSKASLFDLQIAGITLLHAAVFVPVLIFGAMVAFATFYTPLAYSGDFKELPHVAGHTH